MIIPKATKEERERIRKWLMEQPSITPPTGRKSKTVIDRVEFPGEPLSQTIIKARRC